MSYLVLARKFRPQSFAEVSGQEQVTKTLRNAIARKKVGHAYLLTGPRGVGKTSIARIFAKSLNCKKGPTDTPCLECENCISITNGTNLAVREIDGASHNSVENVRELIEHFRALPPPGSRYKVYIIDEVHMLSLSAFNALLKSLEEPPPFTVFILATTEVHKIPETVLSRCQRHDLRALSVKEVEDRLQEILSVEKISSEPEVIRTIAKLSEGSLRDAQSLLERVISFCGEKLTTEEVSQVLGSVQKDALFQISSGIFSKDPVKAVRELHEILSYGVDASLVIKELANHFRELLLGKFGGKEALQRLGVFEGDVEQILTQVSPLDEADLQDIVTIIQQGADAAIRSSFPQYMLEALLIKVATREPIKSIAALFGGLRSGVAQEPVRATSKETEPSPTIVRQQKTAQQNLSWEEFIEKTKGGFLLEHLKRLSIDQFVAGVLHARGPEVSVKYVQEKSQLQKLQELLASYSGHPTWDIVLKVVAEIGAKDAMPGSVLHKERLVKETKREVTAQEAANHPSVKLLQKMFPGSTVEQIKTKE